MQIQIFWNVREYLRTLSFNEQSVIGRQIEILQSGDNAGIRTKQLKGPIRELIIGNHRITYFVLGRRIYFVRGFRKKSKKTPPAEIEYAEKVYRELREVL
jgi:phage-related protein